MDDDLPEIVEMSVPDSAFCAWTHSMRVDTGGFCHCGHEGLGPDWHTNGCRGANWSLKNKVRDLMREVHDQWTNNHADNCGFDLDNGDCRKPEECQWPLPAGIQYWT